MAQHTRRNRMHEAPAPSCPAGSVLAFISAVPGPHICFGPAPFCSAGASKVCSFIPISPVRSRVFVESTAPRVTPHSSSLFLFASVLQTSSRFAYPHQPIPKQPPLRCPLVIRICRSSFSARARNGSEHSSANLESSEVLLKYFIAYLKRC